MLTKIQRVPEPTFFLSEMPLPEELRAQKAVRDGLIADVLTGRSPTLTSFSIVRKGKGLGMERRQGFQYQNMAYHFRDRVAEPFIVEAKYDEAAANGSIAMNTHEGQEFDLILSGALRMAIDGHEFVLEEGDAVYYDSGRPHGMVAADSKGCRFLAVVMQKQ